MAALLESDDQSLSLDGQVHVTELADLQNTPHRPSHTFVFAGMGPGDQHL